MADLFVPHEHSARVDPAQRRERGSLYVYPITNIYAAAFASVALGLARGALDAFVALATAKTPRGTSNVLRDSAVVQAQVGQAERSSAPRGRCSTRRSPRSGYRAPDGDARPAAAPE